MSKFFFFLLSCSLLANSYQSTKIDMHGGNDEYMLSKKKHSFQKKFSCMSDFLDKNSSKSTTPKGK